jgi:HEAT repeat protein
VQVDISDAMLQDKRVDRLARKRDVEGLLDLLEHGDGNLPAIAAHELGFLGDARAVEPLLRRLHRIELGSATGVEEYEWVCLALALGRLSNAGSPAADALLKALERPDRREFRIAALALADTGDRRAIEPLLRRLEHTDPSSLTPKDERDAEYAINALGELKTPEAVDALIAALEIESLREDTAHALGDIGDPRARAGVGGPARGAAPLCRKRHRERP